MQFPTRKDAIGRLPEGDVGIKILEGDTRASELLANAKLAKFSFPDRSWLIVAEHDTHDGGLEWDQAVFYDNYGKFHTTDHHFCSWEGLMGELSTYKEGARSVDDFYKNAAPIL